MSTDTIEIGTVRGGFGELVRVKAMYATYRKDSGPISYNRIGTLLGFELDNGMSVKNEKGEDVQLVVFIPRSAVDRLCGLLAADIQSAERREFEQVRLHNKM